MAVDWSVSGFHVVITESVFNIVNKLNTSILLEQKCFAIRSCPTCHHKSGGSLYNYFKIWMSALTTELTHLPFKKLSSKKGFVLKKRTVPWEGTNHGNVLINIGEYFSYMVVYHSSSHCESRYRGSLELYWVKVRRCMEVVVKISVKFSTFPEHEESKYRWDTRGKVWFTESRFGLFYIFKRTCKLLDVWTKHCVWEIGLVIHLDKHSLVYCDTLLPSEATHLPLSAVNRAVCEVSIDLILTSQRDQTGYCVSKNTQPLWISYSNDDKIKWWMITQLGKNTLT